MTMTIPTIPELPAGYVVQEADMNNLAYCCTFLLTKPIAMVYDSAGGQSIATGPAYTTISWGSKYFDTDGMWTSSAPTVLTVQTPGWYKVRWGLTVGSTVLATTGSVYSMSGANNPGGSGNMSALFWSGYSGQFGTAPGGSGCGGLWPYYLWAGDQLSLLASASTTGETTVSTNNPSWFSAEYVSIQET
jgi:hypothetical protein